MPPKKKVDKKDDGKEAESGPDPAREQEKEIVTSELEIQGLTAKLARWQSRGKALAEENLALVAQLEEARRVMDETNDPLSRQLRSTHAETLAKESELLRAGEELERILSEGAELERREADDARTRRAALEDELTAREATVREVDEFASTRDKLDLELREKKLLLKASREDHRRRVDDVNTEFKIETAEMKREHTRKIKEAKSHMRALIDEQLAGTTKQTAAENERMEGEIAYQVRTTLDVIDRNETIIAEHAAMAAEMDELRLRERELAESNAVHSRAIRTFVKALMERGEVDRIDKVAKHLGDAVATDTLPQYCLERTHTGALVERTRRKPRRRAGKDEAEVAIARRVAEARFERERVGAALIAAAAAEKELETVVEEAASRARKECERFLAACVEDAAGSGGEEAEAKDVLIEDEDGDDGDAEGRRRRRATARRVLAAALEKPEAPLADATRGMFELAKPPPVVPPTDLGSTRGFGSRGPEAVSHRGAGPEAVSHRGAGPEAVSHRSGSFAAERRVARSNADLFERSGFRQRYVFTTTRRR
mgnify:CR=1 FL=1